MLLTLALATEWPLTWHGHESMFHPASAGAHAVLRLWWFMFIVAAVVCALVSGFLWYAVVRGRRNAVTDEEPDTIREVEASKTMRLAVGIGVGITVIILFAYLAYDFTVGRVIALPEGVANAVTIDVVGHQWWWEVTYDDTVPRRRLTTANEIHVPVGRPILFRLQSRDVIHSFWLPNLSGKKDLIPGHKNTAWFVADTPGVYRGQCAEFCGHQHSKMAVIVIAESAGDFAAWYERQLAPATPPLDSIAIAGARLFMTRTCSMCHSVQGTSAGGRSGPELTHVASRITLAAGVLPNRRETLRRWIADPQNEKPGVQMPATPLTPAELDALVAYLEQLR